MTVQAFTGFSSCGFVGAKAACLHGGLSPGPISVDRAPYLIRPPGVPGTGFICDLLRVCQGKSVAGRAESYRGASLVFGLDVVAQRLNSAVAHVAASGVMPRRSWRARIAPS